MLLLALMACHPRYPDFYSLRTALEEQNAPTAVAPAARPLPPDMDLGATTWKLRYIDPDADGLVEFNVVFEPGGRLHVGNPADTTPDNDTWSQLGQRLTFSMNDAFVTYTGALKSRHAVEGSAVNVRGERWAFTLERQELQPAQGWDAELGPWRWSLQYPSPLTGEPRDIGVEFRSGGVLYSDESDSTDQHAWSRTDAGLRFSFNNDYAVYTSTPSGEGWAGTATNVESKTWDFTLTRTAQGALDRRVPPSSGALFEAEGEPLAALLAGTDWQVTDYDPQEPTDFTLRFDAGGVLTRSDLGGSNPAGKDTWEVQGHEVVFRINDGFTEHRCLPLDDTHMIGWARNQDGYEWAYTLTRR